MGEPAFTELDDPLELPDDFFTSYLQEQSPSPLQQQPLQQHIPSAGYLTPLQLCQLDYRRVQHLAECCGCRVHPTSPRGVPGTMATPLAPNSHPSFPGSGYVPGTVATPSAPNLYPFFPSSGGMLGAIAPTSGANCQAFSHGMNAYNPSGFAFPVPELESSLHALITNHFGPYDKIVFVLGHLSQEAMLTGVAKNSLSQLQADRAFIIMPCRPVHDNDLVIIKHLGRKGLVRVVSSIPGCPKRDPLEAPSLLQTIKATLGPEEEEQPQWRDPYKRGSYHAKRMAVRYRKTEEMNEMGEYGLSKELDLQFKLDRDLIEALAATGWFAMEMAKDVLEGTRSLMDAPWYDNFKEFVAVQSPAVQSPAVHQSQAIYQSPDQSQDQS